MTADPGALVRVALARNVLEAEIVCGLLRTDGIRCMARGTNFAVGAGDGLPFGHHEVLVRADDAERARQLLESEP
jgi:hypothetical protein